MSPTTLTAKGRDRRRRPRLMLAYPLRLFRMGNGSRVETKTENISCDGFFCTTKSFLSPREKLECELILISGNGQPLDDAIILRCRAEVVRVVRQNEDSTFGVGCRVVDYTVERPAYRARAGVWSSAAAGLTR